MGQNPGNAQRIHCHTAQYGVREACAKHSRSRQREGWPAGNGKLPKPRRISDSLRPLAQMQTADAHNGKADFPTANDEK